MFYIYKYIKPQQQQREKKKIQDWVIEHETETEWPERREQRIEAWKEEEEDEIKREKKICVFHIECCNLF